MRGLHDRDLLTVALTVAIGAAAGALIAWGMNG
jgi:hypothetical protein